MRFRSIFPMLVLLLLGLTACGSGGPHVEGDALVYTVGETQLELAADGALVVKRLRGAALTTLAAAADDPAFRGLSVTVDEQTHGLALDFSSLARSAAGWQIGGQVSGRQELNVVVSLDQAPGQQGGIRLGLSVLNEGQAAVQLDRATLFGARVDASQIVDAAAPTELWAFLGGSYGSRPDWIAPLEPGFERENYQGMNAADYGGGIPATDIWSADGALLVASIAESWQPVALPVIADENGAKIALREMHGASLDAGQEWASPPMLILAHEGDYYDGLHAYGRVMQEQGLHFPDPPESAFEPMWCAWGYERGFHIEQVYQTLPKVKELGYRWVGLDDGFQTANGDWDLIEEKFPGGPKDMKTFVDSVHAMGFLAMLWWVPGDADPRSSIVEQNPDWVVENEDGSPAQISWWDTYYLDPDDPEVLEHQRALVRRFIGEWGYDGLKTDGQCFNLVPPDYGDENDPWSSTRHSDEILRVVYEEAKSIKPDAVLHNCPCGCVFSIYNMPWTDQYVSSDPTSSWQIRSKHVALRAIVGQGIAFYGDHVELSTDGDDFASTVGLGGVPGSKFTWPTQPDDLSGDFLLTPEREQLQRHWLGVYREHMLPKAEYRSLYVTGFDLPEAYSFVKDGAMYYSFYADEYEGSVQLRGLEPGVDYEVVDYDRGVELGSVTGPIGTLNTTFDHHLLLRAVRADR